MNAASRWRAVRTKSVHHARHIEHRGERFLAPDPARQRSDATDRRGPGRVAEQGDLADDQSRRHPTTVACPSAPV